MLISCKRRGWRLANSSTTSWISTPISLWMWRSDNAVSRSFPMVDPRAVFMRLSPLKDRSEEQLVTGRVHKINSKVLMFGNIDVACGKERDGVVGKEACPCRLRCCCHFMCQQ